MHNKTFIWALSLTLFATTLGAGLQAVAFGTICTECIMPPTHIDKLRQNIMFMGKLVEEGNPLAKHTVQVTTKSKGKVVATCTGAIVSDSSIAVSAHCMDIIDGKFRAKGDEFVVDFFNASGKRVSSQTSRMYKIYDGFDRQKSIGDLGVISLSDGLPFGFEKVALSADGAIPGEKVTVAAFGFDGKKAGDFKYEEGVFEDYANDGEFLTVKLNDKAGTCSGDSGAPAFKQDSKGKYLLVGILSGSLDNTKCDTSNNTGYYTNLENRAEWIEAISNKLNAKTVRTSEPKPGKKIQVSARAF